MKRIAAFLVALLLSACLATAPSVNGQLKAAYDTVDAYTVLVTQSFQRGRISIVEAAKGSENAKAAKGKIDLAATALAGCKGASPCDSYTTIMQQLQPMLFDLERRLREEQGAKP